MSWFDPVAIIGSLPSLSGHTWQRAVLAFFIVAALIPIFRPGAMSLGIVDHPGGRKDHASATALHGGLCILLSMVACALLFDDLSSVNAQVLYGGSTLMLVVGMLDDRYDLNWRVRIGAQALAAVAMVAAGLSVHHLGDVVGIPGLELTWLALPVSIFIVVGVINALNMSDGSDGLAGGQALVSFLLFACFAFYAGNVVVAERLLAGAAAIAGFLAWNFRRPGLRRAAVFMGDAGSMVLGFMIAWAAVRLTQDPLHPISPVLGPWTIAIPLIDCVSLIFRRLRQGRSPFAADRDHLHHLLHDAGFSPSKIALGLMAASAVLGLSAAAAVKLGIYRPALVLIFLALIALHYYLTSDRSRAVAFLRSLRGEAGRVADPGLRVAPEASLAHSARSRSAKRGPERRKASAE